MNNKIKKLIISAGILLIGILGSLLTKYLPKDSLGLVVLMIISVCKFGGLIMFVVALIKFFSKEKFKNEMSDIEKAVKRNRLLMYAMIYFMFGVLFCFSSYLLPFLCGKDNPICPVTMVGLAFILFIPLGIVFIIICLMKLYKFFKK